MARKGENIRKRKDGRWEGRMTLKSPNGEKKVHSVYGNSYHEVKDKMYKSRQNIYVDSADLKKENRKISNAVLLSNTDWSMLAEKWLENVKITKKHSTFVKYQNIYQNYIASFFQSYSLDEKIDNFLIDNILERCADCSDSLQNSVRCVLKSVFSYAVEKYDIEVPVLKKERHKKENNSIQVLSEMEQIILCRCLLKNMNYELLGIFICITTGIRLGEVCSLKWSDIDFTAGILHINSTVQRITVEGECTKTKLVETAPKTSCSKREIPLPGILADLLKKYYRDSIYIINKNVPMEPRTYQNIWKRCQKEAGIQYKNFHSLRHTFATNCISQGIDVKSLSEILGHSNVQTTLNRYVHPSIETKRAHINSVCVYFLNTESTSYFYEGSSSGVK